MNLFSQKVDPIFPICEEKHLLDAFIVAYKQNFAASKLFGWDLQMNEDAGKGAISLHYKIMIIIAQQIHKSSMCHHPSGLNLGHFLAHNFLGHIGKKKNKFHKLKQV